MKKILYTILLLSLGIAVGFGIGFLSGIFTEKQQDTLTPVPTLTETLSPTETLKPTLTETPTPTETSKPTLTETPTPMETPEPTLMETQIPKPTRSATATPTPAATVSPTKTAEPTKSPAASDDGKKDNNKGSFYGALHVEGTHLAAADGSLVQLRGISTHGLGWFPDYVNAAMLAQAGQEWGCNVFRLAMYTAEYNGYCTSDSRQKEKLKTIIDSGVQAAIEQDMYVIIDWHILSDGNPNTYKEEAKKFFAEMAEKYADVPNVLYEICNEPNGGTSWEDIRSYALEVIPVIRKFAPEAIIIVGTPTWSQDVDVAAGHPITEYDNIMYALHFYAATHTDSLRNKCKTAVSKGLPLFVTEYGISEASGSGAINETQAQKWIELLDGYGISHVLWNLSNKSETSAMISSSCSKTSGFQNDDLSASGKWFVRMMQNAGFGGDGFVLPEDGGNSSGNGSTGNNENSTGNGSAGNNGNTSNADGLKNESLQISDIFEPAEQVELTITNSWVSGQGQGIQLNVVIKNAGASEETDWVRTLHIRQGKTVTVSQCWCAKVQTEGSTMTIRPEEYNKTVPAAGEVGGIGIIVEVR